jgi:uncharacterized RDD family membrane protein YckC
VTTSERYINEVIDRIPRHLPLHDQVAKELASLFAERQSHGESEADAARQLGDPGTLADSYLAAVPLTPAPFMARVAAKVLDYLICVVVCVVVVVVPVISMFRGWGAGVPEAIVLALLAGGLLFWIGSAWAEARYSQTPGKKLMHLYVVRESGARISAGQAIVRQLPAFLQIFMIDALFALFTERHQRAFELLSRTRTVKS